MSQSSNQNRSGGSNQNRSGNQNRNRGGRGRNRNRSSGGGGQSRGGGGGGGGGQSKGGGGQSRNRRGGKPKGGSGSGSRGGFVKQKVPRRTKPLTWWEKLLNLVGLGPKLRNPPTPSRPPKAGNAAASLQAADGLPSTDQKKDRPRKKPSAKKAASKKPRPERKPEKVPVSGTRLHVGNLSYDTNDEDLDKLFSDIGSVVSCEVVTHGRSGRSKGFAFVEMESVADAERAADELHDKEFMGRPLTVGGAKSSRPTD